VPGVLAEVNRLLASHGVNVDAQALNTRGEMGYLVTDITTDFPSDVLEQLERMPWTVRLRVLAASA
jgi:D-3-phosphoglycerate dehydrogenase